MARKVKSVLNMPVELEQEMCVLVFVKVPVRPLGDEAYAGPCIVFCLLTFWLVVQLVGS